MTTPIELYGQSGPQSGYLYGDGAQAGATGGGLFGEGVSQSQRTATGPMTFGGLNAPPYPYGSGVPEQPGAFQVSMLQPNQWALGIAAVALVVALVASKKKRGR